MSATNSSASDRGPRTPPSASEPASLVANSGVMFAARVFLLLTGGAVSIYAVRTFTTETYGRYAVAAALIGIFGLLSEMGITTIALREMAMEPRRQPRILGIALWSELITSGVAVCAMFLAALVLGYRGEILALLAVGAGIILLQGVLGALESAFQARRLLVYAAVFVTVQGAVAFPVGFSLIAAGAGPAGFLTGILAGWAAATVAAFILIVRKLRIRPEMQGTWRQTGSFVRAALPVAASGGAAAVYDRVDVLMLSKLDSERAVALYHVPLTMLQYSMIIPAIIATAFFPLLAELLRTAPATASASFGLLLRIFVLISVPIALVLSIAGEPLLTTVFGDRYEDSAAPLAILAWLVVLGFVNYLFWYCLLAAYREGAKFKIMLAGLALNVALNLVLIPPYGPRGAAISLLVSDLLVVVWQGVLVHRHLFSLAVRRILGKPALAGIVSLPVGLATLSVSQSLAGLLAALAYVAMLLVLRYVSWEEWQPLMMPAKSLLGRARSLAARA